MDREIDSTTRRNRIIKRIAIPAGAALVLWLALASVIGWAKPSIRRSDVRTARVERGSVEAAVSATGVVVPAFEKVISTPVDARVLRIVQRPGAVLRRGDTIVELDLGEARLVLDRLDQQLAEKRSLQQQARTELEEKLSDLRSRAQEAQLDAEVLDHRVQRNAALLKEGLLAESTLRESEVEAKKAHLRAEQLRSSMNFSASSTVSKLASLDREIAVLERERTEKRNEIELGTSRSDRDGVLTWVTPEEGVILGRGSQVARIADLSSYRIQASTSDVHATRIKPGMTVKVDLDGTMLDGKIATIDPTIVEGALKFLVDLDTPSHAVLHNNRRAEVHVVTGNRPAALRVRKGPFAQSDTGGVVFVVEGDRAVARKVKLGLSGYMHYEVVSGLDEGDEVIISNMEDYLQMKEVRIR
jgi:HlyD family secretion protein